MKTEIDLHAKKIVVKYTNLNGFITIRTQEEKEWI